MKDELYARNPIHGIVRSRSACTRCGIRAWRWHRPPGSAELDEDGRPRARLVCVGCDHTRAGEHYPTRVLFRPPANASIEAMNPHPTGRVLEALADLIVKGALDGPASVDLLRQIAASLGRGQGADPIGETYAQIIAETQLRSDRWKGPTQ